MKKKITALVLAILCAPVVQASNSAPGQTLASVITISREDIRDFKALDIADVLRQYAGFSVTRTGGVAQEAKLSFRGNQPNQTAILVDGVRINSGNTGLAALQNIKLEMVERIEITKGPRSARYGSGAIGGVINIITRQPKAYRSLAFMLGSNGARQPTLQYHATGERQRGGISLLGYSTAGEPDLLNSNLDNPHYNNGVNLYYKRQLGAASLDLNGWLQKGNTEYVESATQIQRNQDFDNESFLLRLSGQFSPQWGTTLRLSRMLAQDHVHHRAPNALENDIKTTRRNELDWQNDVALSDAHQLTLGFVLVDDKSDARIDDRPYVVRTASKALYLQDRYSADKHSALLAVRQTDHDAFGRNTSWNAEYAYQLSANASLVGLAGTAYREPTAIERAGINGNNVLEPEQASQIELAFRYRFSPSQTLDIALFQQKTKKLIELDAATSKFTNRGKHENSGVEFKYAIDAGPWGTRFDLVVQKPKDKLTGAELGQRAKNTLTTQFFYQTTRSRTALQFVAVGARKEATNSTAELGGYGLINLSSRVKLGEHWRIQGKVENVADKQYQTVTGYSASGLAVYVDLEWLF